MNKLLLSILLTFGLSSAAQAACPSFSKKIGDIQGVEACQLSGKYTDSNLVLSSDKVWVLKGGVFIGDDNKKNSTITIPAGTKVVGQTGADFLVITRGSKIFAQGTSEAPIVFTTAKTKNRNRGEWGGLIINGNAPINGCGLEDDAKKSDRFCTAEGEGSTGVYGGNNPEDNSGVLKYVRVEFAGFEITPDNELNGIAFQGVGSETEVDYIQVHMNADDGVEFFGGTVNVKHVLLTGNKDDSMDWTAGWVGKAQFVIVDQYDDQGNNGIEADNKGSKMNSIPRSRPILSNLTFLGTSAEGPKGGEGILLRKGTAAEIYNTIVTGFKRSCFDIDNAETFNNANNVETGIIMENVFLGCDKDIKMNDEKNKAGNIISDLFDISKWFTAQAGNQVAVDPMLNSWVPKMNSPLLNSGEAPLDIFFDEVDFIGAVKDSSSDWTKGWTINVKN